MSFMKSFSRYLLAAYKRRKQRLSDTGLQNSLIAAKSLLERSKYCFLITKGETEFPSARLVEPLYEADLSKIYIGTNPDLRKIREIESCPYVTLAFTNKSDNANVVIQGVASVCAIPEYKRKHWKRQWRLFFPNGSQGIDYTVITVEVQRMEVLSFKNNVIPEPFGLKPVTLVRQDDDWVIEG